MGLVGSLDKHSMSYVSEMDQIGMGAPGGVEPPTNGLGNRCSIQLSYGATRARLAVIGAETIEKSYEKFEHFYSSEFQHSDSARLGGVCCPSSARPVARTFGAILRHVPAAVHRDGLSRDVLVAGQHHGN